MDIGEHGEALESLKGAVRQGWITIITGFAMLVAVIILSSLRFSKFFTDPIIAAHEMMDKIAKGDFKGRLDIRTGDEIEQLSKAMNEMSARLEDLYSYLGGKVEMYRSITEISNDAVICLGEPDAIILWNKRAEKMFGFSVDEAMGRGLHDIIVPERYREKSREGLKQFFQTGTGPLIGKTMEHVALRSDGTEFPIDISIIPMKIQDRWQAAGIIRDITERKKAEREMEEERRALLYMLEDANELADTMETAKKELEAALENLKKSQNMLIRSEKLAALGQLSAGVAHEIKNPLNIISTSVQLLMMDEDIPGENMEAYKVIMEQIARAAKITENLRDFARERKPEIKDIDLHGFLEKTIALVEYELKSDNIYFTRDFHPSPIYVKGDADQLAQVFLNLINNAADSMKEKQMEAGREQLRESGWEGNLAISTSHDGEWVFIKFKDRGTGIPLEKQKMVFDPFFTTKPEGKGTGLGLSIAMGIIENHGGAMLLESVEGEGATFIIKLPGKGSS